MNVMQLEKLIRRIREAISVQGLMQKEIATHAGMTPAMFSNAMAGRTNMREERWRLVCEYCGIDFDEVMGYRQPDPPADVFTPSDNPPPTHNEEQGETNMNDTTKNAFDITLTPAEQQALLNAIKLQVNTYISTDSPDFETLRNTFRLFDKIAAGGTLA